jgi:hypothetical protein
MSSVIFSLVSVVVDHASFRLILVLLTKFICVNSFLGTNLSSFSLPGCRLLLMFCCVVLCGTLAALFIISVYILSFRRCSYEEFYLLGYNAI